ncbi:MFS domain-containing protein [Caenorhabditis elegans]|uniref:MFS domain-containing protein n=1 Tax=Caenorhabditis elegans TaxID=6239 RepID=A0A4V0IJT1_CAEEL|nr:MFS domain-containing protein [Caenorhabditis elegans]VTW47436.1 MFS domain-containing protein [Caenorhabditis elegans]
MSVCRRRRDPIADTIYSFSPFNRICVILFGAVSIHLTIGTYHTFGNMLPYMASYMRNFTDPSVRIEHMMWIPTFQGCFPFAMVIGGLTSSTFSPRVSAFIGCFLVTSSVALSAYAIQHSFALFFIVYGLLFGLGSGIAYVTAVSTAINWAPDKIGVISGIVAAGFGLSSSIFAPIQTMIVNPLNLPATKDGYFLQPELLHRVPALFTKLAVIYGIMQAMALIVVCDPPFRIRHSGLGSLSEYIFSSSSASANQRYSGVSYSRVRLDEVATSSTDEPKSRSTESILEEDDEDMDEDYERPVFDNDEDTTIQMTSSEMLKSPTFYCLFASLFCCSFYANMFYNLYKTYGESFIEDDMFMAMAFSIASVANAIARIGWGYLTDRTSFQIALSTATCLASVFLLTMPMTRELGKMAFLFWLVGTFICMGATHALFITATVKCFGNRHKANNYGYLILSTTTSGILLAAISQFYLKAIGYTYLFIITSIFPFCAFIFISCIQWTPQGKLVT